MRSGADERHYSYPESFKWGQFIIIIFIIGVMVRCPHTYSTFVLLSVCNVLKEILLHTNLQLDLIFIILFNDSFLSMCLSHILL